MKKKSLLVMSTLLVALIWTSVQFAASLPEANVQNLQLFSSTESTQYLTSGSIFDSLQCVAEDEKIDGNYVKTFNAIVTNGCTRDVDVRICIKRESEYGNRKYWEEWSFYNIKPDEKKFGFVKNDLYLGEWFSYSKLSSDSKRLPSCP